jgi:hypothetical protein
MSLQKLGTQLIKSQPMIHVQDVKDGRGAGSNGAGWTSNSVETSPDLTYINFNSISGASLSVNGSISSTTRSFPLPSATGSVNVNNPNASTHNHVCYVILPSGEYYLELFGAYDQESGQENIGVYNLTDSSWVIHPINIHQAGTGVAISCRFSLSTPSNIEVRGGIKAIGASPSAEDYGQLSIVDFPSKLVNTDLKIYKLD